jgi:hypothetical protein
VFSLKWDELLAGHFEPSSNPRVLAGILFAQEAAHGQSGSPLFCAIAICSKFAQQIVYTVALSMRIS